jgi:hypothetical protein
LYYATTTTTTGFDQQKLHQNILVFNDVCYNSSRRDDIATNIATPGVAVVPKQQVVVDLYYALLSPNLNTQHGIVVQSKKIPKYPCNTVTCWSLML